MESPEHLDNMTLSIDVLRRRYADRPDVFVGGNLGLYYSDLQVRNNDFRAPDLMVVFDAIPDRKRKSWVVWEENSRTPDLVIELLSASTEREDRGRKMRIYASLKVSEYFLYDPATEALEGYRLARGGYVRMLPRADGELESQVLDLRLSVGETLYQGSVRRLLRWKTMEGEPLPTGDELARQAEARADSAEARAAALEARLRALGVDPG